MPTQKDGTRERNPYASHDHTGRAYRNADTHHKSIAQVAAYDTGSSGRRKVQKERTASGKYRGGGVTDAAPTDCGSLVQTKPNGYAK